MLLALHIKNFALIDEADIRFTSGLNMLTGETGAGKSILIDSINFILGDKQTKDIIRFGEDSAFVEGIFSVNIDEVNLLLNENGIEVEDNLIISREISKTGKSVSRINGKAVTVGFLKSIGKYLIDIHGQHEHQSLLNDELNIKLLDLFCGNKLERVKEEYIEKYKRYSYVIENIKKLSTNEKEKLRMIDLLSFQSQEIVEANLKIGEDEELISSKELMMNSGKIYSSLNTIYNKLYSTTIGEAAYDALGSALTSFNSIENYDDRIKQMKESCEDIYYRLEALLEDVRDYRLSIDFNEDILNEVEERLNLINKLKRKYGSTIDEVIDYNEKILKELSDIEKSDDTIINLEHESESLAKTLNLLSHEMTVIRRENAIKLQDLIESQLKSLGMEKAIFEVKVIEEERFQINGKNSVKFLMTANPGQPLKALSKIASGGEISRIMLAIKTVIADIDSIPTLIFDEVDTGVSGRTAQAVAEKMAIISREHQILCITHLPQIAAMSDNHYKIQKSVKNNITLTEVALLTKDEKIEELARLLGGAEITDLTRKNALEVLELAQSYKTSLTI
ncbi:DNA repair protein RecN [Clostridium cylindrosporum]|uniref:DNA repair protein RecN n=1 Tax=Clostridium cylindrosporum DSM 605 TaxID=1121307 RepID=A0A0J8DAM7_CLOCY|nr:DNA repair protein RecN [Clostridium cylindrosporum]KMT21358.1 DNA repair protein RecN [Clostridium cylindrosporum DSM 605]